MIFDKISNAEQYYGLGQQYVDAFNFLTSTDFSAMEAGDYKTMIDGKETPFKVKRYDSRLHEDCKFEKHEKCIDMQYMVSGREHFCYAPYDESLVKLSENAALDCVYYDDTPASRVEINTGMFAIAMTSDVHMPELRIGDEAVPVVKAIVKIIVE